VYSIAIENNSKIWLGTEEGLYSYEKGDFVYYSNHDDFPQRLISALLYDSGGRLWIGTEIGLYLYKNEQFFIYNTSNGLCHNTINGIMEDKNGNIWIATWNGISLFSKGEFINISTKNGLLNNFVYGATEDREGNIWIATHGGAACLTSLNVKTYTKENGLPNEIIVDLVQDQKGRYWFATSGGLSCYRQGKFRNYTTKDGLLNNHINSLMVDRQGKIWIATIQGLSIFSSGTFTNFTQKDGLSSNVLFGMLEARDGSIWIANRKGLDCFKNGKFYPPPFKIYPENIIRIIEDSRGHLWFSSLSRLYHYTGKGISTYSTGSGLPCNPVYTIFEDSKGIIWISTVCGLSRFDYHKGGFTHFSTKNSNLPEGDHYCILEDTKGNLWIGGTRGIICFNGKEFNVYSSERLGLTGRSWVRGIKDNNGALWFGTTEGVTTFYPPPVKTNKTPPPVYITGVKVLEKQVPLTRPGQFNYNENIFRFDFVGLSYSVPNAVGYMYRLENIDKDWQLTKHRSLFYPFLPPGNYNLKVKAINCDGYESISTAQYRFKISPPFWQTWWFLGILGLVFVSLLIIVNQFRIKRIREKAEIKARKAELAARNRQLVMSQRMELMATLAAGNVHDLKNLMAIIIGYSRVMSKKHRDDQEDSRNFKIIKDTAATAVQMAKQILSFARPKNSSQNETVELGKELNEIIDTLKITQPKNIHILWEQPSELIYSNIHPAHFQQVVMNLCLNACQAMPEGGKLNIFLSQKEKEGNYITLEISDTGLGIKEENLSNIFEPMFTTKEPGKGTGLGLFVVKQIVEEYKGKIDVRSNPGQGTTFTIRFSKGINNESLNN